VPAAQVKIRSVVVCWAVTTKFFGAAAGTAAVEPMVMFPRMGGWFVHWYRRTVGVEKLSVSNVITPDATSLLFVMLLQANPFWS